MDILTNSKEHIEYITNRIAQAKQRGQLSLNWDNDEIELLLEIIEKQAEQLDATAPAASADGSGATFKVGDIARVKNGPKAGMIVTITRVGVYNENYDYEARDPYNNLDAYGTGELEPQPDTTATTDEAQPVTDPAAGAGVKVGDRVIETVVPDMSYTVIGDVIAVDRNGTITVEDTNHGTKHTYQTGEVALYYDQPWQPIKARQGAQYGADLCTHRGHHQWTTKNDQIFCLTCGVYGRLE